MCGRYGRLSRFERIAEFMPGGLRNAAGEIRAKYNVAPGTMQPVIRADDAGPLLTPMKWGLVPFWAKVADSGVRPVNARAATAHEKPMFRKLIRERRCLVPVDWFYEWREAPPADKTPFLIQMASRDPFFMGGLWDTWHLGAKDELTTFTILTTEPNELMQTLHHRMPVIIAPRDTGRWLDPTVRDVGDLLKPFAAEEMTAYPVSRRVNSSMNEGPELIAPVNA